MVLRRGAVNVPRVYRNLHGCWCRALGWEAENDYAAGVEIGAPYPARLQRAQVRVQVGGKTDFLLPDWGCKLTYLLGGHKLPLMWAGLQGEVFHLVD